MYFKRLSVVISAVIGILMLALFIIPADVYNSASLSEPIISKEGKQHTVTLITGDKIIANETSEGLLTLEIDPAEREGYEARFKQINIDEDVYVIPNDIGPFVSNQIDKELFNITKLINQGYDDENVDYVPLIISFNNKQSKNLFSSELTNTLEEQHLFNSMNSMATKVKKDKSDRFIDELFNMSNQTLKRSQMLENNIDKIWLDEKVHVALEDSVSQIGSQEAWESGYDGSGIKIAVLDSGIDRNHPDFNGNIVKEKNFSADNDMSDLHGHGTHVASIVGGSGQASDGLRKGVAPGASLMIGKVIGADGKGPLSDIILGMEWSVEEGADIVNMSLGSEYPTDGTDPISQALNNLTEEYGVLFVVSSGNSGPGEGTVTAPGSADAALTVGSVNKEEGLADTSSRGPRLGDYAIKPEITAPGVNINAARSSGTSMGFPIDDYYTSASGTSMAAPHVSGVAAIILGQWREAGIDVTPELLKAALISSAIPFDELSVYEQGGGRVDVEEALNQTIIANPGVLDLGYFEYPHDEYEPVTKTITYHNLSDQDITLHLQTDITFQDDEVISEDMVELSDDTIIVKAGETVEVDVTLDIHLGEIGMYGGYIKASSDDDGIKLQTPVGYYKEPKQHTLTIKGISQKGETVQDSSSVDVVNAEDSSLFLETGLNLWNELGEITLRVPTGVYNIMGWWEDIEDELALVGNPEVIVEDDTTVVLDGREVNEIGLDLEDEVDELFKRISYHRETGDTVNFSSAYFTGEQDTLYASPTEPVDIGYFEFYTDWELLSPEHLEGNPYFYRLVFPETEIPSDLIYKINKDDLAQVNAKYYSHNDSDEYRVTQAMLRDYEPVALVFGHSIDAGIERMEYYNPGDSVYSKVVYSSPGIDYVYFDEPRKTYDKGKYEDTWFKQPVRPGTLVGNPPHMDHSPVVRENNRISAFLPNVDNDLHWSWGTEAELQFYENEKLLAESATNQNNFTLTEDKARYRLELTTKNQMNWTPFSEKVQTNWTFDSEKPDLDSREIIPLLLVNYKLDLDLTNTAKAGNITPISFTVEHQPGAESLPINHVKFWISYNDGEDWEEVIDLETDDNGTFTAMVEDRKDNRDGSGYVSLKIEAWDSEQNGIEQEIIRAYKWNFQGDISGDKVIDIYDVMRAITFYGSENQAADINGDGIVDEKDLRILEKNFLKVGPGAAEQVKPIEKLGTKSIDDLLRSIGLEPTEE